MQSYGNFSWNSAGSVHIPRVHGEVGATQYSLPPNSDILLMDDSNPIVYLKSTDAAGYGTVSKWAIQEIKDPEPADFNALTNRMSQLEVKMEEMLRRLDNGKSNFRKTGAEQQSNAKYSGANGNENQ